MPDNSVDSIVTDPPYELGFMGKSWDSTGIANSVEMWSEALRVLKPGGHLLAFSGSRTYHRMAVAIEDAGFEIRDQIMWVYGCLSEDTEILINGKWEHYRKAKIGDSALCYDVEHDTYSWQPIEDTIEYDYADTAYRIHSDRTDQIVSKNHRCIVESDGKFTFRYAETLELQESVPILENLSDLLDSLSLPNQRTSNAKSLLFQRLYSMGRKRKETIGSTQGSICEVYGLQKEGLEARCLVKEDKTTNLLKTMQRENQGDNPNRQQVRQNWDEVSWNWIGRRIKSSMEGGRNLLSEERELQTNKIHQVPSRIFGNGSQRRLHNGTQIIGGTSDGSVLVANRNSPSHQPRPTGQSDREFDVIQDQPRPQTVRGEGFTVTDLVRVEEVTYMGKVWCVKVPTGAFVTRRNGKVFVTGNSGFPKSHNISKTLDKMSGVKPTIIGSRPLTGNGKTMKSGFHQPDGSGAGETIKEDVFEITVGTSPEAQQWEGWGTALKPAHEPIVLARKPFTGTVANNVLAHGTGGINIDGCRVGSEERKNNINDFTNQHGNQFGNGQPIAKIGESKVTGRFPANFIHDGSDEVLALFPQTKSSEPRLTTKQGGLKNRLAYGDFSGQTEPTVIGFGDSGSAARFFYCAKTSKKDRNEGLDGFADGATPYATHRPNFENTKGVETPYAGTGRSGKNLANFHPTVKPTDLMRYLVRLVTPPNGIVLDPFMGSGSTGKACMYEGFSFIGIDMTPEYVEIARARIEFAEGDTK